MTATAEEKLHVQIGEVKIGRDGQVLNAILGSCIGLGFIDTTNKIYGLAHCLLSKSATPNLKIGGRHVDQAIRSLCTLMNLTKRDLRKIQAIVVGGANMTLPPGTDPERLVGTTNAQFAYQSLRDLGMRNIHVDVGGVVGRQVIINCSSGEFTIAQIPRLGE